MDGRTSLSSLKFEGYVVEKVMFQRNQNLDNSIKEWNLTFDVKNETKINSQKNKMKINLSVEVFKEVKNAPFIIEVEIAGVFSINGDDDILKFEANAIAIMYPYLRAIVSTYTSAANVVPVILPAINVNAMLKRKKEENNNKENQQQFFFFSTNFLRQKITKMVQ